VYKSRRRTDRAARRIMATLVTGVFELEPPK